MSRRTVALVALVAVVVGLAAVPGAAAAEEADLEWTTDGEPPDEVRPGEAFTVTATGHVEGTQQVCLRRGSAIVAAADPAVACREVSGSFTVEFEVHPREDLNLRYNGETGLYVRTSHWHLLAPHAERTSVRRVSTPTDRTPPSVGWETRLLDDRRIEVTATVTDPGSDVESVVAATSRGLTDVEGSRTELQRIGPNRYRTVLPAGGEFEWGEAVEVRLRAADVAGNTAVTDERTVQVPRDEPPTLEWTAQVNDDRTVTVEATARDEHSGVERVEVAYDAGPLDVDGTTDRLFPVAGDAYRARIPQGGAFEPGQDVELTVRAVDGSGNVEAVEKTVAIETGMLSRTRSVTGSPVSLRAPEGGPDGEYEWRIEGPGDPSPADPTARVTTFRPERAGTYEVTVDVTRGDRTRTYDTTLRVDARSSLLDRYAPVLHFAAGEAYQPTRIEAFVHNGRYVETAVDFGGGRPATVFDLHPSDEWDAVRLQGGEADYPNYDDAYPPTVYGSVHRDVEYRGRTYVGVTYWLFYVYDPKSDDGGAVNPDYFVEHAPDLETVTVLVNRSGPQYLAASQHYGGEVREWEKVDRVGNRPHVYPAKGSHANFLRNAGKFDGNGFAYQRQFLDRDGVESAFLDPTTPIPGVTEITGDARTLDPSGRAGEKYDLVPLTGDEYWVDYRGSFAAAGLTNLPRQAPQKSRGVPTELRRWDDLGEWIATVPVADEEQLDVTADVTVTGEGSYRTATVDVTNAGPKPHEVWVSVAAKPQGADWGGPETVETQPRPIAVGTGVTATGEFGLPVSAEGDWTVRVTVDAYRPHVAGPEDRLDVVTERFQVEPQPGVGSADEDREPGDVVDVPADTCGSLCPVALPTWTAARP